MNQEINGVIPPHSQPMKMIVQRKGKERDKTCRITAEGRHTPGCRTSFQIPNGRILNDRRNPVKMERTMKGVGINPNTHDNKDSDTNDFLPRCHKIWPISGEPRVHPGPSGPKH